MAKTSVHLKPCNIAASETHNKRLKKLDYVREDLSHLNQSFMFIDHSLSAELAKIKREVKSKTNRKLQKNANPIKESVIVIKEDTTIEELKDFCNKCNEKYGIIPLQIFTHLDEGHYKQGKWIPNLHAHITWRVYDENGRNVSPTPLQCSQMQDIAAECLGMERGKKSTKKHASSLQFKIQKLEEQLRETSELLEKEKSVRNGVAIQLANLLSEVAKAQDEVKSLENRKSELQPNSFHEKISSIVNGIKDASKALTDPKGRETIISMQKSLDEAQNALNDQKSKQVEFQTKVMMDADDRVREIRMQTQQEIEESGDYKWKYEQLLEENQKNRINSRAWSVLPLIEQQAKENDLDLDLPTMMSLAQSDTIILDMIRNRQLHTIGENDGIEMKFDFSIRKLVARAAHSMKQRGMKIWLNLEDWISKFDETLTRLHTPKSEQIRPENKRGLRL